MVSQPSLADFTGAQLDALAEFLRDPRFDALSAWGLFHFAEGVFRSVGTPAFHGHLVAGEMALGAYSQQAPQKSDIVEALTHVCDYGWSPMFAQLVPPPRVSGSEGTEASQQHRDCLHVCLRRDGEGRPSDTYNIFRLWDCLTVGLWSTNRIGPPGKDHAVIWHPYTREYIIEGVCRINAWSKLPCPSGPAGSFYLFGFYVTFKHAAMWEHRATTSN